MPNIYAQAPAFHRPQVKPKQWGPVSAVKNAVRDYYENELGVAAPSLLFPMIAKSGATEKNYGLPTLSDGTSLSLNNNPTWKCNKLNFGGTNQYGIVTANYDVNVRVPFTIIFRFSLLGSNTSMGVLQWASSLSSGAPMLLLQQQSGTTVRVLSHYAYWGAVDIGTKETVVAFSRSNTTTGTDTLYINGAFSSSHYGVDTSSGVPYIYLANGYNGYAPILVDWFELHRSLLPSDIIARLATTPYAAIQPRSVPVYFFPASGGGEEETYFMPQFMNHKFIPSFTGGPR